ncbi:MAG: hypothetical protein LC732_11895 [Acidobacteria bacterium]|nr:hypothetical protein [Acidobacteriota bacterium]
MRKENLGTLALVLLIASACASSSRTGEESLFRIDVERVQREDQRASVRVVVRNDSSSPVELLDFAVRPAVEGAFAFESLSTTGPFLLDPGQEAVSSFALAPGGTLPDRLNVEVTFRRGAGPMERKSYWAELRP